MIVGPLIQPGVGPVAVTVLLACITTRWVAPLAIRLLAISIQNALAAIAALMIPPEYYVSSASRRHHRSPPQFAYDYGAAIGSTTLLAHRIVGVCLYGLAKGLRAIPMVWIAVIATVVAITSLLELF